MASHGTIDRSDFYCVMLDHLMRRESLPLLNSSLGALDEEHGVWSVIDGALP
jgi:hypothetical protein